VTGARRRRPAGRRCPIHRSASRRCRRASARTASAARGSRGIPTPTQASRTTRAINQEESLRQRQSTQHHPAPRQTYGTPPFRHHGFLDTSLTHLRLDSSQRPLHQGSPERTSGTGELPPLHAERFVMLFGADNGPMHGPPWGTVTAGTPKSAVSHACCNLYVRCTTSGSDAGSPVTHLCRTSWGDS
jgi:hypothetical protein